ncbi:MAG: protoporphyrinogen oxidase [Dissulfurispiraceae bacterium]
MKTIIVGAGISGLSLAYALLERTPELDVTILEAENRPGGKIWTVKAQGFVCEAGVNGFLDNKPSTLDLASRIKLTPIRSNDSARKRAIYTDSQLRVIPESPGAFFKSDFLSLWGRLRMVAELFVPRGHMEDESMESFAVRRVGREFFEKLLDPMASGVYAGDPSAMSIRSCFSKVYELEKNYGGLIKGFMALGRESKKAGKKVEAGPGGTLMSFKDGMYSLVETLRQFIGDRLMTGKGVSSIDKKGNGFEVYCTDGSRYESDCVVLASPAHDSANIIRDMDRPISDILRGIPYPPVSVVALGFEKDKIQRDLNLFGFLIPGKEKRRILGTLFDSSIYANRAPEGHVLLRTLVGGARAPEIALLDDENMVSIVREELADILGIKAEPDLVWTYRWERAIPQYLVGHHGKLRRLDEAVANHNGLYLHGNAYRGVSVNDCISNSFSLAEKIASHGDS